MSVQSVRAFKTRLSDKYRLMNTFKELWCYCSTKQQKHFWCSPLELDCDLLRNDSLL